MAKDRANHSTIIDDYKKREGHLRTVNKVTRGKFTQQYRVCVYLHGRGCTQMVEY